MRLAAIILGVVGGLAAAGAGVMFLVGVTELQRRPEFAVTLEFLRLENVPESTRARARLMLDQFLVVPHFFFVALPLAFLGSLSAWRDRREVAGVLMIVALSGPVVLACGYLVASFEEVEGQHRQRHRHGEETALMLLAVTAVPATLLGAGAYCAFAAKKVVLRHACPACKILVFITDAMLLGKTVKCDNCGCGVPLPEKPPRPGPTRFAAIAVALIVLVYFSALAAVYGGYATPLLLGDLTPNR